MTSSTSTSLAAVSRRGSRSPRDVETKRGDGEDRAPFVFAPRHADLSGGRLAAASEHLWQMEKSSRPTGPSSSEEALDPPCPQGAVILVTAQELLEIDAEKARPDEGKAESRRVPKCLARGRLSRRRHCTDRRPCSSVRRAQLLQVVGMKHATRVLRASGACDPQPRPPWERPVGAARRTGRHDAGRGSRLRSAGGARGGPAGAGDSSRSPGRPDAKPAE